MYQKIVVYQKFFDTRKMFYTRHAVYQRFLIHAKIEGRLKKFIVFFVSAGSCNIFFDTQRRVFYTRFGLALRFFFGLLTPPKSGSLRHPRESGGHTFRGSVGPHPLHPPSFRKRTDHRNCPYTPCATASVIALHNP